MYKKYVLVLLFVSVLMSSVMVNVQENGDFFWLSNEMKEGASEDSSAVCMEIIFSEEENISGNQPIIEVMAIQRQEELLLCPEDKMILYKIVEAEAGTEDRKGKILVANVILNRLEDDSFPDTIAAVVFQNNDGVVQFSPVANGSYDKAIPKEDTIEAVDAALAGEDYSEGALFFAARKYADAGLMEWFDNSLVKVTEHGGHEFYR